MCRKTPDEVAWLRENAGLHTRGETLRRFEARFGWAPSRGSLASWMYANGIKGADAPLRWTAEMDGYLCEIVPGRSEAEIAGLFEGRFGVRLSASKIGNRKARLGLRSGTPGGRFAKGHIPANKGKNWDEWGLSPETQAAMRSTCYQPGAEPPNGAAISVGTERTTRDGYIQVKVTRFSERPGANKCWRMKHHLVWEEAHGTPVPAGSMIVFADRDRQNFAPDNLLCVPRALWAVISHERIAYYDRESLEAAAAVARIKQAVSKAAKGQREAG